MYDFLQNLLYSSFRLYLLKLEAFEHDFIKHLSALEIILAQMKHKKMK